MSISVVISYCNNDFKFIEENVKECKIFSNDINIIYSDYSFDGQIENVSITSKMILNTYGCKHHCINYEKDKSPLYHHNLMRYVGFENSKNDYILFLDADEIFDGQKMSAYLSTKNYKDYDAIYFKCYWYFREKFYRAKNTEDAGLLVRKNILNKENIFVQSERYAFINKGKNIYSETHNGEIICHHYSWVRTKEEMIKKVSSWAHREDKNWVELIEDEFSGEFKGRDFIHNYEYIKI